MVWYSLCVTMSVIALLFCDVIESKRVLLIPLCVNSHVFYFLEVGVKLQKAGHEVEMLLPPRYKRPEKLTATSIKIVTYEEKIEEFHADESVSSEEMELNYVKMIIQYQINFITLMRLSSSFTVPAITNALSDNAMFNKLNESKYNFALLDGFIGTRFYLVLLYRLGIPYGILSNIHEPWLSRSPALPSFSSFHLAVDYTEQMTFSERLLNLFEMVDYYFRPRYSALEDQLVSQYAPEKPFQTLDYLARQSRIWFISKDILLDYPMPLMPNVFLVGGLTTNPAKPLPDDFAKFVTENESGFLVVSFGSILRVMPDEIIAMLLEVFSKLPYRIVWRFYKPEKLENIPGNVLVRPWIPQNDLLGHPMIKLFVTHAGSNGQFEALYHGVPLLSLPIFGDQFYNAKRAEYHGYSLTQFLKAATAESILADIKSIITDPKFKTSIEKASQIYKSREKSPTETVVYWMEHVMEFGADHLRSYALEMPWYQYLMLDILAFVLLVILIVTVFTFKSICYIYKCCFIKTKPKQKLT